MILELELLSVGKTMVVYVANRAVEHGGPCFLAGNMVLVGWLISMTHKNYSYLRVIRIAGVVIRRMHRGIRPFWSHNPVFTFMMLARHIHRWLDAFI